jgi:hypothetical protein
MKFLVKIVINFSQTITQILMLLNNFFVWKLLIIFLIDYVIDGIDVCILRLLIFINEILIIIVIETFPIYANISFVVII